ncbi:hypothetical protein MMC17_002008 [Xylographa soralifera]|nr:hypothetical protein [Xylographa soralifera]
MNSNADTDNAFPFMRLPIELRYLVLSYTRLVGCKSVSGKDIGMFLSEAYCTLPLFTTISKQFREDARFVFFSYNHFVCDFTIGEPTATIFVLHNRKLEDLRLVRRLAIKVGTRAAEQWGVKDWQRWDELMAVIAEKLHLANLELSVNLFQSSNYTMEFNITTGAWALRDHVKWLGYVYQNIERPLTKILDFKKLKRLYIFLACTHDVKDEGKGDIGLEYDSTLHGVLALGTETGQSHSNCHFRSRNGAIPGYLAE